MKAVRYLLLILLLPLFSGCSRLEEKLPYEGVGNLRVTDNSAHGHIHVDGLSMWSAESMRRIQVKQHLATLDVAIIVGPVNKKYPDGNFSFDVDVPPSVQSIALDGHVIWRRNATTRAS